MNPDTPRKLQGTTATVLKTGRTRRTVLCGTSALILVFAVSFGLTLAQAQPPETNSTPSQTNPALSHANSAPPQTNSAPQHANSHFAGSQTNSVSLQTNSVELKAASPDVKKVKRQITGAELYSINCNRCHQERYPTERTGAQWKSIMLHMQVRANIPVSQAKLILQYLQDNSGR